MLTVGLTGGIGSGKSTAAEQFAQLGVPIIDADVIAREVVEPGTPALEQIVAAFGEKILDSKGRLDRGALRNLVFSQQQFKSQLEDIVHPRIHAQILARLKGLTTPYCIVVIPLLAESQRTYPLDRVLVIDVPEAVQLERTVARDRQPSHKIDRIIQSQASREARLQLADDIIENTGDPAQLVEKVCQLHEKYTKLAQLAN